MNNELSINPEKSKIDLEDENEDGRAALVRGVLGTVPFAGNLMVELVNVVIPNQKAERLKTFALVLDQKLRHLDKELLEVKMKTVKFADLFEDALPQAARATSDKRREYIAQLLKKSLTADELTHAEQKKLLSILDDLNDQEIVVLHYHALEGLERHELSTKHHDILYGEPITFTKARESPELVDKEALRESYKRKLIDMALLKPRFWNRQLDRAPEFDLDTGLLKASSYEVSNLGRLFLRYILDAPEDETQSNE